VIIIALSDIHSQTRYIPAMAEALLEADVVLVAGDITDFGTAAGAREVIETLRLYNPTLFAVPGNCDGRDVEPYLAREDISLHNRRRDLHGIAFAGLCRWLIPDGDDSPGADPYRNLPRLLADAPRRVLLTHQPAWGTAVDTTLTGKHAGNPETRDLIEQLQPLLAVSGHVHEAPGIDHIGPTTLVNPGPARRGHYAKITLADRVQDVQLLTARD